MTSINLRWQLSLAVLGSSLVILLFALDWLTPQLEALPRPEIPGLPTTPAEAELSCSLTPTAGGVVYEGFLGAPQYLNPLLNDANPVDQEISALLFNGLLQYDNSGRLIPDLAQSWQVSEDGTQVTFTLQPGRVWHDGQPVTAGDVAFTYNLFKDPAFPSTAPDKRLWEAVSITILDNNTVQFTLPAAYSPFLEATTRGLLPQHILGDVPLAELPNHIFNTTPVGTGPFMVAENWRETGRLTLIANPAAGSSLQLNRFAFRFYPSETALLEAFRADEIQTIHRLNWETIPEAVAVPGLQLYNALMPRYTQLLFNVESGAEPLQNLAVRQALAHAINKPALISQALNGQGLPLEGPYLPQSLAYDPQTSLLYPHSLDTAAQLLDTAGITSTVPGGQRQFTEGNFVLRLVALNTPANRALTTALETQWQAAGVGLTATFLDLATLETTLTAGEFDVALVEIEPPHDPDLYDFWSQEAMIDGRNYAGWSNRRASEALESARQLWNQDERVAYYRAFLKYFADTLPAVTLYQHIYSYGVSEQIQGVDIGRIETLTDRYLSLPNWYIPQPLENCPEQG